MMPNEPVAVEHEEIIRGIGGLVHTVLLAVVARSGEVHARPVLRGAYARRHAPLHPGNGISNRPAFFRWAVVAWNARHERADFRDVARREGEGCLRFASIGMADRDGVRFRSFGGKLLEMSVGRAFLLVDAAAESAYSNAHQHCEGRMIRAPSTQHANKILPDAARDCSHGPR